MVLSLARDTRAQTTQPNGAQTAPGLARKALEVRLAMSPSAARFLNEARVRALVEIELEDGVLAPGTGGPLGDYVAYVWIDHPTELQVVIEARVGDRPIVRREISTLGLDGEVAARLVAIAAMQTVRAQAEPLRPKRVTPPPKRPSPEDIERADRRRTAIVWEARAAASWMPRAPAFAAGPELSLAFRSLQASERLFASWLAGPAAGGAAIRWGELGLGADYRLWLGPDWRLALGGVAAVSSVEITSALGVSGDAGANAAWSARGAAELAIERRVGSVAWIGLSLEPGAIFRPVDYGDMTGAEHTIGGAWLGAAVGLSLESRPARNGGEHR